MNLQNALALIESLTKGQKGQEVARRLARDVGHELPRNRLSLLREIRAHAGTAMAKLSKAGDPESAFAEGMLFALTKIIAAYDAEISDRTERRGLARLTSGPIHALLLDLLASSDSTLVNLVSRTSIPDQAASDALGELVAAGLIEKVPPDPRATGQPSSVVYRLTPDGVRQARANQANQAQQRKRYLRAQAGFLPGAVLRAQFMQRRGRAGRLEVAGDAPQHVCNSSVVFWKGLMPLVSPDEEECHALRALRFFHGSFPLHASSTTAAVSRFSEVEKCPPAPRAAQEGKNSGTSKRASKSQHRTIFFMIGTGQTGGSGQKKLVFEEEF